MGRGIPTRAPQPKKGLNPVWRGVGCLLLVILTGGGFLGAGWFVQANYTHGWIYLPPELAQPLVTLPPGLPAPLYWLSQPWLGVKLVIAVLVAVLSFAILTVAYGVVNPIRPGKFDAPPQRPISRPRR
ncbi:MAG: hypothetical protein HY784_07895 [Chloroflexi bacterium]|nr:hypothetical protein [Chloroflexota bacterium]